jgi:hypothetical protein
VIAPFTVAPAARPPAETTLRERFAEPVPDAGLTCSHGWFDVAVQATVPEPLCVNRTTCAAVCARNAAPFVTAANRNDVLSSVIVGSVPLPLPGMFRTKMSQAAFVSPLTRFVEDDGNAMTAPLSLMAPVPLNALPCPPPVATLTRVVVVVCRSCK